MFVVQVIVAPDVVMPVAETPEIVSGATSERVVVVGVPFSVPVTVTV